MSAQSFIASKSISYYNQNMSKTGKEGESVPGSQESDQGKTTLNGSYSLLERIHNQTEGNVIYRGKANPQSVKIVRIDVGRLKVVISKEEGCNETEGSCMDLIVERPSRSGNLILRNHAHITEKGVAERHDSTISWTRRFITGDGHQGIRTTGGIPADPNMGAGEMVDVVRRIPLSS